MRVFFVFRLSILLWIALGACFLLALALAPLVQPTPGTAVVMPAPSHRAGN